MDRLSGHDWSNIVGIPLDVPDYNGGSELYWCCFLSNDLYIISTKALLNVNLINLLFQTLFGLLGWYKLKPELSCMCYVGLPPISFILSSISSRDCVTIAAENTKSKETEWKPQHPRNQAWKDASKVTSIETHSPCQKLPICNMCMCLYSTFAFALVLVWFQ
jgi:hypothetical protein